MEVRKSIAYAYATSNMAKILKVHDTGGYYLKLSSATPQGSVITKAGTKAYTTKDDPALIEAYKKDRNIPCPYFMMHGSADLINKLTE